METKSLRDAQLNIMQAQQALKAGNVVLFLEALVALMPDLKMVRGKDGHTPKVGQDFYTPTDRENFIQAVLAHIHVQDGVTPVRGKDYPDAKQIEKMIRDFVSRIGVLKGDPGYTPIRGVDYFTDDDIWAIRDRVLEKAAPALRDELVALIQEAIANSPRVIERRSLPQISLVGRGGARTIEFWSGTSPLGQDIRKVIFDGNGVVSTRVSDGVILVTISGSATGSTAARDKLTPTASGSNITLDLTALPHTFATILDVVKNGQVLDPASATFGWSRSSNTITVLNAADTDVFLVGYTY